ncbi:squalene cyclase [Microbacterium sp. Marseille-Q6965]|uniref:squalene cyclase n=1 Tax=Microbacterium sp. Marseille-Q6965 TaxID=2965072 RepID=UPI0021B80549|nr:squalene cyclase [Microbacterium sp. Marseille-Q6965]
MGSPAAPDREIVEWMRGTDPALAWQVERDLLTAPERVWQATRARVPVEGRAARLLRRQDPDGTWAGGAFFPSEDWDPAGTEGDPNGQPWVATTWSLNALREWGVDASVLDDTADRIERAVRWEYDGLPYWGGEVDVCINAWTLSNGMWLGRDMSELAQWFVDHEMDEGGWNCEWVEGSTRASVESTLNGLLGVLDVEIRTGGTDALRAARHRAEEYLLQRRLLRTLTDGRPVVPYVGVFMYPARAAYTVLRALDYFRAAHHHDGRAPDPRLADAITLLRERRNHDGTWTQEHRLPGRVWFHADVPPGEPSPWLTFTALRILRWWEEGA